MKPLLILLLIALLSGCTLPVGRTAKKVAECCYKIQFPGPACLVTDADMNMACTSSEPTAISLLDSPAEMLVW